MSALIPDNVVKAPLIQTIQERDNDVARAAQQSHQAFSEEMARMGSEAVRQAGETDQNGVDEDTGQGGNGGNKKKRQARRYPEDETEDPAHGWTMGPDDDGKPHHINIIA